MRKNILIILLLIIIIICLAYIAYLLLNIEYIYKNDNNYYLSINEKDKENIKVPKSVVGTWTAGTKKGFFYKLDIYENGIVLFTTYDYDYLENEKNLIIEKDDMNIKRKVYAKRKGYINNFAIILNENYDLKNNSWYKSSSQDVREIILTSEVTMRFGNMTSSFVKE